MVPYETKTVIIPEEIPEDLFTPPDCPEIDEITWADARGASEHYRTCKDLRGQRIKDIGITARGRWDWMREQAEGIKEDNQKLKASTED